MGQYHPHGDSAIYDALVEMIAELAGCSYAEGDEWRRALGDRDDDVMLVSHDGDFLEAITPLMDGRRRVGLIAFEEFRNSGFHDLVRQGMEFFDLEHDTRAFNAPLPRLRIIPIEQFDPQQFL